MAEHLDALVIDAGTFGQPRLFDSLIDAIDTGDDAADALNRAITRIETSIGEFKTRLDGELGDD